MKNLALVVALALTACGGSDGEKGASLNPEFTGRWVGPVVVTSPEAGQYSYTGELVIAASGGTASVANLCFDGTGTATLHGDGSSAAWTGLVACATVLGSCNTVTQTFKSMQATLTNGVLSGGGTGNISGCGWSYDVTYTMTATKMQ